MHKYMHVMSFPFVPLPIPDPATESYIVSHTVTCYMPSS